MIQSIETDVVVIGGGIAGLWLFRTLNLKNYKTVLLEQDSLGGGQSIKSQGIIHGGTKYTLTGNLTGASQAISEMPDRWRKALAGKGGKNEPDLSNAGILSEHHYLWSPGDIGSRMTSFFASKAVRGRVKPLESSEFPAIFKHDGFRGKVYALNEIVLDIASVVKALVADLEQQTIKVDWSENGNTRLISTNGNIDYIEIKQADKTIHLKAKRYVTTAGEGTEELMNLWGIEKPKMQVRPLHMPLVRVNHPEPIYAHCLGTSAVPRITVTSHPDKDGKWVWYLGGGIAEDGVKLSEEALIATAKKELGKLLPWVNLEAAEWGTLRVNRAEPKQSKLLRPDAAFCQAVNNGIVSWPTKLALAPNLADEVVRMLEEAGVAPSLDKLELPEDLPQPEICPNFWSDILD